MKKLLFYLMLLVGFNSYSQVILVDDHFNVPSCQSTNIIIGNVLDNDSIDGNNFLSSDYGVQIDFISFVGYPNNNAATLNMDYSGNIRNQSASTISGTATIFYSVYSIVDPSISWAATAVIEIPAPYIQANNDIINYIIGGDNGYLSVIENDTECFDFIFLSQSSYDCQPNSDLPVGVSINSDGGVSIDEATVLPGVYTIDYIILSTTYINSNYSIATLTLTIVPNCINTITPNFTPIAPICSGATLSALPTTSTNGIVGTWSPALNNLATTTYTFTPNVGQCADSISMTIIVNPIIVPIFTPIAPICTQTNVSPLPTTSTNGITGTWSPVFNGSTSATYTFTPNAGQCATTTTLNIIVNGFTTTSVCLLASKDAMLHENEPNRNFGANTILQASRWTYGFDFKTTKVLHLFDLSSIPAGSIITSAVLKLHVDTTQPLYNQHRDLEFMGNDAVVNEVGGLWSENTVTWNTAPFLTTSSPVSIPSLGDGSIADVVANLTTMVQSMYARGINNGFQISLTNNLDRYRSLVFGSRENTNSGGIYQPQLCVTYMSSSSPTFTQIAPICSGEILSALPTTSSNGITGIWSPALNNTTTTTYTFTPNAGQCSNNATMTIVVNPQTVPTFNPVGSLCQNSPAPILPATSTNGIAGTWSPSFIDTFQVGTFVYMFTPDTGQCAMQTAISITINPAVVATFTAINPITVNSVAPSLPTTSNNAIIGTWFPAVINTSVVGSFVYTFTPDTTIAGQECAIATSITVEISNCVTTTIKLNFWNTTGAPNRYITCQPVTLPTGSTITKYGVEVTNMTSNAVGTFESTAINFRLIDASPSVASYGTSFSVRVKLQINGTWQCYGIAKVVSTNPLPPTANLNTYCGQILPTINKIIYCSAVSLATSYLFEISQITSTGTLTTTYSNTLNNFKLTDLNFNTFPILFNKIYTIRTKVKTMVNGVEVESAWSSPCSITTPPAPPAVSMISGCGTVLSNATLLKCTLINFATDYKFDLTPSTSMLQIIRPFNSFSLSMITGIIPGTSYTVTPSYKLYGQWYTGTSCTITTPAGPFKSQEATINQQNLVNFAVKAYPNPFAENFKLNVTSSLNEILQIKIYDMLGKLVENKETNISDIETLEVGTNYPSGVYNVVVSQGENVQSLRIIKR